MMVTDGLPRLLAKFAAAKAGARIGTDRGVYEAAESLLESTIPVTPVEDGTLRASGRVEKAGLGDYAVSFGGGDAPYAIYVHEDLEAAHEAPTKAKFLEETYLENKDDYAARIKRAAWGGIAGV